MILTCFHCPRQIAFPGRRRRLWARRFGWRCAGRHFHCSSCAGGPT